MKTQLPDLQKSMPNVPLRQRAIQFGRISLLFLCLVLAVPGFAQSEKTAPPPREEPLPKTSNRGNSGLSATNVLAAMDEDYRIGANDVLEIEIDDAPELSGTRRVNANGTFLMPYLGRLTAKGKTPEDLAQIIASGLDQRYLFNPRVNVVVKQYNSRSFFIQGSVRSPGVYQIEGRPTILELLTVAGGLANDHASTAFVIRKLKTAGGAASEDQEAGNPAAQRPRYTLPTNQAVTVSEAAKSDGMPQYTLHKTNLVGLLRGNFGQNFFLEPGDIVNIPQTEMFFVAGEVQAPGSFALKEGTSLRQAIALAQGTNFKAASNRTVIFRESQETGQRQEIQVDLGAVMSGKANDLPIMANDIIIIPNSKMKTIAAPMLSALGMSAVRIPIRY
jgi:polysaccharide biosynthesis/export protein